MNTFFDHEFYLPQTKPENELYLCLYTLPSYEKDFPKDEELVYLDERSEGDSDYYSELLYEYFITLNEKLQSMDKDTWMNTLKETLPKTYDMFYKKIATKKVIIKFMKYEKNKDPQELLTCFENQKGYTMNGLAKLVFHANCKFTEEHYPNRNLHGQYRMDLEKGYDDVLLVSLGYET